VVIVPERDGDLSLGQAAYLLANVLDWSGFIVTPSDTGYALTTNPLYPLALQRVQVLLQHALDPIPLTVGSACAAARLVDLSAMHKRILMPMWPGPVTLVAPIKNSLGRRLARAVGHQGTLGLRVSTSANERHLCVEADMPLTSAAIRYPDGRIVRDYADAIDIIWAASAGLPALPWAVIKPGRCFRYSDHSTVVGLRPDQTLQMLREGVIPAKELEPLLCRIGPTEHSDAT
jgi:tRNA A37 threonylcarbamoyladenosine synthetase subunit TsaC/SUA5/YrdC